MSQKQFFVVLTSIKNFRSRYYFLKDDLIYSSDEPVPHVADWLAKATVDRFIASTSAMTKRQLLDLFGEYELQLHVKEVDDSDSVENAKVVAVHDIEPVAFQNGIITKGFETGRCLTVRELKAIVANWPELTDDFKPRRYGSVPATD